MTTENLKHLRQSLPDKWAVTLAGQFGLAIPTIRSIIYGFRNNHKVLMGAYALMKEFEDEKIKLSQSLELEIEKDRS